MPIHTGGPRSRARTKRLLEPYIDTDARRVEKEEPPSPQAPPAPAPPAPPAPAPPAPPAPAPPAPAAAAAAAARPWGLPKELCALGNASVWRAAALHFQKTPHLPLVVAGPVGSGKSCGVRQLLEAMAYRVLELDGADAEHAFELVKWVTQTRRLRVMMGKTAIVLDDFEGFTAESRRRVVDALQVTDARLAPVVITCNNAKELCCRPLQKFATLRLLKPSANTIEDWFASRGVEVPTANGGWRHHRVPESWLDPVALASGDLRRIRLDAEWRARLGKTSSPGAAQTPVEVLNPFEAVRKLFLRASTAETFAASANMFTVDLVRQYAPEYLGDLEGALEDLSLCDTLRGREVAHDVALQHVALHITAHSVRLRSVAKRVGSLVPSPTLARSRIDRDLPAALRASEDEINQNASAHHGGHPRVAR